MTDNKFILRTVKYLFFWKKKKTLKTHSYLKHIVLLKKEKIIFRYSQLVEIFGNSLTTTLLATLFSVLIISLRKKYQKNETSEWF